jgi:hypothetical protein
METREKIAWGLQLVLIILAACGGLWLLVVWPDTEPTTTVEYVDRVVTEVVTKTVEVKIPVYIEVCSEAEPALESAPEPTSAPVVPTAVPQPVCDCSYNRYNCEDFGTHQAAQACFEYCGGLSNDIHRLDGDGDGSACESLP